MAKNSPEQTASVQELPAGADTDSAQGQPAAVGEEPASCEEFLIDILESGDLTYGENTHRAYVTFKGKKFNRTFDFDSEDLRDLLIAKCMNVVREIPTPYLVNKYLMGYRARAKYAGKSVKVCQRVGSAGNYFCYNLCNDANQMVAVSKKEIVVGPIAAMNKYGKQFVNTSMNSPQVKPVETDDVLSLNTLLKPYLNLNKQYMLLVTIVLVSYFIPDKPNPILIIQGEQGCGKSTLTKVIRSLVDPAPHEIGTLKNDVADMRPELESNFMCCYDNNTYITDDVSNVLCIACTGGAIKTRKKYSDATLSYTNIKNAIIINSNVPLAANPDLMDRSIVVETIPISLNRETELEFWANFNEDKPKILRAIFQTVQKAMQLIDTIEVKNPQRLLDFQRWGLAICQAMFDDSSYFDAVYCANRNKIRANNIEEDPVAQITLAYFQHMFGADAYDPESYYEYTTEEFYNAVKTFANAQGVIVNRSSFPGDSSAFTKRLKKFYPDFKNLGYRIEKAREYDKVSKIQRNMVHIFHDVKD